MSRKSLIIGMVLIVLLFSGGFVLADFSPGDGAQTFNSDDPVAGIAEGEMDSVIETYPACWDYPTQCHGDSDNDGLVKGSDFLALKDSWYKCYGDRNYNPCADFDRDGCVKGADFLILKSNWYKRVPADCPPSDPYLVWVYIDDPGVSGHEGFTGYMSKYETTNAQYCQFLNAALASGDVIVDGSFVRGADGSNSGTDFVGQRYYWLDGPGYYSDGASNGGAARINYSGGVFYVDRGFANHPVTYVSWYGATAFSNYYGYRLPTEWEWQAVADYNGSYTYGCGTSINNSIANYYNSTHPDGTTVVGSFGTYGYGMCDMAGNVWEWTDSISRYNSRVIRGGSWGSADSNCAVSTRHDYSPFYTIADVGFRLVLDF